MSEIPFNMNKILGLTPSLKVGGTHSYPQRVDKVALTYIEGHRGVSSE